MEIYLDKEHNNEKDAKVIAEQYQLEMRGYLEGRG
jgi:hypothetical protein